MDWKIGQEVIYKLPNGSQVFEVIDCSPSSYIPYGKHKRIKSHYVTLYNDKEAIVYSAYDKNLIPL